MSRTLPGPAVRVEEHWGTAIGVTTRRPANADLLDDVFAWFRRIDELFSTWRDTSEISRLGRGELEPERASPDVRTVLALCHQVHRDSRGAFDITVGADPRVPPRTGRGPLDPSGLVKGWALEHAADMLVTGGTSDFTINAGGDILTRGRPAPGAEWRVGIQHPWQRHKVAAIIAGAGEPLAAATSGRYEQGEHIIDPRTARPPTGLMAVTVVGPDLALADGYATAAIVLGHTGMTWLAGLHEIEAIGITDTGTAIVTDGFDRYRRS